MPGLKVVMSPTTKQFSKYLDKVVAQLAGRDEPHQKVGAYMSSQTKRRFNSGKDAEGTPWKALAPSTIRTRQKKGIMGIKPLLATGKLKKDVHYTVHGTKVGRVRRLLSNSAMKNITYTRISAERKGKRHVKARVHQGYGIGTHIKNVPSRPYIGMNQREQDHTQDIFMKYLTKIIFGIKFT